MLLRDYSLLEAEQASRFNWRSSSNLDAPWTVIFHKLGHLVTFVIRGFYGDWQGGLLTLIDLERD